MPAYRDARDGRWRFRKKLKLTDGRLARISGTPPINTKAAAEAEERRAISRALGPSGQSKEVPTFAEFVRTFLSAYASKNKPSEQATKRWILNKHLLPAFGRLRLDAIDVLRVHRFRAGLSKGRSPKTVNNVVGVLTRVLRWAVELELIARAPRIGMLKVPPSRFEYLEDDDYEKLRSADVGAVDKAAILSAGDAGLRRGEILALEWGDVDLRARRLVVRRSEWHGKMGGPKGGKERTVPLTDRLALALGEIRGIAGRVFIRPDGSNWTWEVMRWALPAACERAGIRRVMWHALRHTFCSALAARGVPAKAIQELAGHQDLKTTLRYMHLAPAQLDDAIGRLEKGVRG